MLRHVGERDDTAAPGAVDHGDARHPGDLLKQLLDEARLAVGRAARSGPLAAVGGLLLRQALGGLRAEMDPDATGGAILLGLRGVAVVGHGSTGALGIANQIRLAARSVEERTVARTEELIERSGVGRSAIRGGADVGA